MTVATLQEGLIISTSDFLSRRLRAVSLSRRRFIASALSAGSVLTLPLTLPERAAAAASARAETAPGLAATTLPETRWHLTARPWRPTGRAASEFLDVGESIARVHATRQAADGSIMDAYTGREQQYQTPYFAASVAMLVANGRALDLLPQGIAAMDRATAVFEQGRSRIPDDHGEFFVAALAKALPLYRSSVSAAQYDTWRSRLTTPLARVLRGMTHNWRTYAMKGEWLRARGGYVDRVVATRWIEKSWTETQRGRLTGNRWNQYSDRTSDPDTHVYDAAARSNLFSLVIDGYDGPSRVEMITVLLNGARTSLLMQEPSGQNPAGGRSGGHVWNDVYSGNVFAQMAEYHRQRDPRLAGQYRHAALLNLASIGRWRRDDGSYSVTKNHFDPAARVGYADYSWFQNYNGNVMFHSLESYELTRNPIDERPVPAEIGGVGFATDATVFASAFANAGGMHMQASMAGSTEQVYGQYWTVLGVSRFGRAGWDSRVGPSDGVRDPGSGRAASFAPVFEEDGAWKRLADLPGRYEGTPSFDFVHPLLVRWSIVYAPTKGLSGPTFRNEFVVTPDGVLSTITSTGGPFGVTLPVVENDGRALDVRYTDGIVSVSYPWLTDEQNFIALQDGARLDTGSALIRGAVGDVRPARLTVSGAATNEVFVYPRSAGDPTAADVRSTFDRSGADFSSSLGRVQGSVYIGRTSAGGYADTIDIRGDGQPEVTFSAACNVVLQLDAGVVTAVEVDREVTATIQGRTRRLVAFTPVSWVGSGSQTPDPPGPADLVVVASSEQPGRPAVSVLDGDASTRWSTRGLGQYLTVDLGVEAAVAGVGLAWYRGADRVATFDVLSSSDGTHWSTVAAGRTSSGTSAEPESLSLDGVTTRFLRIVNRGNTENDWIALTGVDLLRG
ncbi:MAG: discoidin domain-containing protein [Nakamurella sp.]